MREEKTEGIVLRSLEYKERQRILTVFTEDSGLVSLIVKGLSRRSACSFLAITSVFSRAEFYFVRGRSELYRFVEGSVLEEHLFLRQKYSFLQAAGVLAQSLLRSQLPGKASPALYALFRSYLKQIVRFDDLQALTRSFQLKLLRHEGLIALHPRCLRCDQEEACAIDKGESVCARHAAADSLFFSEAEWAVLMSLASVQQFHLLRTSCVPAMLSSKIIELFERRMRQE